MNFKWPYVVGIAHNQSKIAIGQLCLKQFDIVLVHLNIPHFVLLSEIGFQFKALSLFVSFCIKFNFNRGSESNKRLNKFESILSWHIKNRRLFLFNKQSTMVLIIRIAFAINELYLFSPMSTYYRMLINECNCWTLIAYTSRRNSNKRQLSYGAI